VPACHCICGYTLTIPPPHTLPYYPQTKHPLCPLSQTTTIEGGLPPPSTMGARRRQLRLARVNTDSVCLRAHTYLYNDLQTSDLASHPHNTLAYNHTSLPPPPCPHSATSHIRLAHSINTRKHPTPTPLGKVYKRALVVPPSSHHQRVFVCGACTGTAQVGVSLVFLFDPLFKQSRLNCLDICLT